jgi:hypothetical protein
MAVTSTIGVDEGTEETADAAGVVGVGAVADSIVVPDGATDEADDAVAWPNIFAIRLVNIPIKTNLSSFAISGQLLLDFETCLKSDSQYAEIKYAAALWFWFPFVPARKGVPFPVTMQSSSGGRLRQSGEALAHLTAARAGLLRIGDGALPKSAVMLQ